ncbi:hypothetical protein IP92_05863 [Pseudoduganella flava]|uniref:Uncharacterized protein n=1 Tax=Pseudoduganella flava TaxID=871742 RepID=A0A562P7I8_9BURK|nr:hypothetical protein [Pseudoduganella flava]QGZ40753.1 hypothetical protein GO485_17900 [Pseudoduganella flava]TWI40361.1 hypothetical protein IP92_05863 [Pseudoduganella flava]
MLAFLAEIRPLMTAIVFVCAAVNLHYQRRYKKEGHSSPGYFWLRWKEGHTDGKAVVVCSVIALTCGFLSIASLFAPAMLR